MRLPIVSAVEQTAWAAAALAVGVLASLRRRTDAGLSPALSEDIKGFAILAVVFSHVGYFLVADDRFLFPLSIFAGVAVNSFLFLSGYGLARQAQARKTPPLAWYRSRLAKLFIPLWIALAAGLLVDRLWLGRTEAAGTVALNILGLFPTSDLFGGFDAPLWYFTFILGWYLIFPALFRTERPFRSAFLLAAAGLGLAYLPLPVDANVAHLYRLHVLAFPFGVAAAGLATERLDRWRGILANTRGARSVARAAVFVAAVSLFLYASFHGRVGEGVWPEQLASLAALAGLLSAFLSSAWESRLLRVFGRYSYEIYLVHWPILARYGGFPEGWPAAGALAMGIALVFAAALVLRTCAERQKQGFFKGRRPLAGPSGGS